MTGYENVLANPNLSRVLWATMSIKQTLLRQRGLKTILNLSIIPQWQNSVKLQQCGTSTPTKCTPCLASNVCFHVPPPGDHHAHSSPLLPPPGLRLLPEYQSQNLQISPDIDPFVSCPGWHEHECINTCKVKFKGRCRTYAKLQALPSCDAFTNAGSIYGLKMISKTCH